MRTAFGRVVARLSQSFAVRKICVCHSNLARRWRHKAMTGSNERTDRANSSQRTAPRTKSREGLRKFEEITDMMRMKNALAGATLAFVAFAAPASAQSGEMDADRLTAARELIAAQDTTAQMSQLSASLSKMVQEQASNSDPATAKSVAAFLQNALSPSSPIMKKFIEDLETLQVKLLAADLTVDEMRQLTAFMKSDLRRKYETVTFKVLANSGAIVSQFQKGLQIEVFEQLTKQQPKNAGAWNGLCWATITAGGDPNKALDACNTAIKLNAKCPNYYDSRGLVYLKLQDYDRALSDYEAALKLNPKMMSAQYGRGIAKIKRGDIAAGSDDVIAAKAANPNLVAQFVSYGVK
jgi:tetratricopeptide (TPR) repeat protein